MSAIVDVLVSVKNLLVANWISDNTDSLTPEIMVIMDAKTISLADYDYILLYEVDEGVDPFGIGAKEWAHERIVSIDIRTRYKRAEITAIRAHLTKIKDEVFRIFKANVTNPDADHHLAMIKRKRDLSDKSIGLGRIVVDVSLKYYGA